MTLTPTTKRGLQRVFRPSEEYQIFDVRDWKLAGHALEDYVWLWHYSGELELKVRLLEKSIVNLEEQRAIETRRADSNEQAAERLSGLLDGEQARQARVERAHRLELWLWRSGVVVAIVAAGVFGGMYAAEKNR